MISNIYIKNFSKSRLLLLTGITGGLLWVVSGIILTVAPSGHPPHSYRTPALDIRFPLAIGLLFITGSIANLLPTPLTEKKPYLDKARHITIAAGLTYLSGRIIRNLFLNKTGWEPLLPLGFLGSIVGLYYLGAVLLKHKMSSSLTGILLLVTATFLLLFNEQYLPVMAVPFGLAACVLTVLLGGYRKNSIPQQA